MDRAMIMDMAQRYIQQKGLPNNTNSINSVIQAIVDNPTIAQQYASRGDDFAARLGNRRTDLPVDSMLDDVLMQEEAPMQPPAQTFAADMQGSAPSPMSMMQELAAPKQSTERVSVSKPAPAEARKAVAATNNVPDADFGGTASPSAQPPMGTDSADNDWWLPIALVAALTGGSALRGAVNKGRGAGGALAPLGERALANVPGGTSVTVEDVARKALPAPAGDVKRLTDQSGNNIEVDELDPDLDVAMQDGNVVDEGIQVDELESDLDTVLAAENVDDVVDELPVEDIVLEEAAAPKPARKKATKKVVEAGDVVTADDLVATPSTDDMLRQTIAEELAAQPAQANPKAGTIKRTAKAKKLPEGGKTPSDTEGVTPRDIKEDEARRTGGRMTEAQMRDERMRSVIEEEPFLDTRENLKRAEKDAARDASQMSDAERRQAFGPGKTRGNKSESVDDKIARMEGEQDERRIQSIMRDKNLSSEQKARMRAKIMVDASSDPAKNDPNQYAAMISAVAKRLMEIDSQPPKQSLKDLPEVRERKSANDNLDGVSQRQKELEQRRKRIEETRTENQRRTNESNKRRGGEAPKQAEAEEAAPANTEKLLETTKNVTKSEGKKLSTRQRELKAKGAEKKLSGVVVGATVKVDPKGTLDITYKGKKLGDQNWATVDDAVTYIQSRIKDGKFVDKK